MAMAKDAYSQALQNRRGGSMDPSLVQMAYGGHPAEEAEHEVAAHGGDVASSKRTLGEEIGYPGAGKPKPKASEMEGDQVAIADVKQGQAPAGMDEEAPHVDSDGDYDEDAGAADHDEIRDHIIGHESPGEYDRMKESRPTTLGERVKMAAMKEKYAKA